jgi:hypothetical protein
MQGDIDHGPPGGFIHASQRLILVDSGIAYDNLYRSTLESVLQNALSGRGGGDIELNSFRAAVRLLDFPDDLIRASNVAVCMHKHVYAI